MDAIRAVLSAESALWAVIAAVAIAAITHMPKWVDAVLKWKQYHDNRPASTPLQGAITQSQKRSTVTHLVAWLDRIVRVGDFLVSVGAIWIFARAFSSTEPPTTGRVALLVLTGALFVVSALRPLVRR